MSQDIKNESQTIRVRIWDDNYEYGVSPGELGDPDKLVEVEPKTVHIWQDNPHYHSPSMGIDIHPDDRPAGLNIYTSDSIHSPPDAGGNYVEEGYWDGPVEGGLDYDGNSDIPPFGCELWDRVMFFVEPKDSN